jgi:hypothetical protein
VFRDGCGGFSFKIADFGFAVKKEQQNLILPIGRTRLWAAPEHSSRRFTVKEVDRMDWYSFGLTCFWLLIRKLRSRSLHDRGEEFNVSTMEKLKARNELLSFAEKVMEQDLTLSADQKHHLSRFFSSYLALDPKNRAPMIHLLYDTLEDQSPKQPLRVPIISSDISQIVEESKLLHPVSVTSELVDSHPHFQVSELLTHVTISDDHKMKDFIFGLALADYRIRVGVVDGLHETYQNSQCLTCKRNAAFQLALCTFIPFGHLRRPEHFSVWISRSGSSQGDLESELDGVRRTIDPTAKQSKISDIASEYLFAVDPAQEYRDLPSDEFTVIKRAVSEELQGCRTLLGETHSITVTLTRTLAGMMNGKGMFDDAMSVQQSLIQALKGDLQVLKVKMDLSLTLSFKGRLKEVEALRSEVVARLQETIGYDHAITLSAMAGLASVLNALGRSTDAEQLLLKVIDAQKRKLGPDHFSTLASMSVLVAVYCSQLRHKEAEELQSHIVKMRKKILGDKHAHTWTSQLNMAAILSMQGRLKEAELLELEVINRRIQHLGAEHPETLTAMSNLAVTYRNQKRWKEEEATLFQIIAAREKVLGREHPDTMGTAQALANNYLHQGRPNDAETWGTYAAFKEIDGRAIANMTTLAWARFDQGHQDKAEEQLLHAINTGKEGLGECNGDVLNCMRHLAMMNKCRGRLLEAKQLHDHVWKMRQKVLGDNHKDTLRSRQQLEEVESLIQRRAEEHPK